MVGVLLDVAVGVSVAVLVAVLVGAGVGVLVGMLTPALVEIGVAVTTGVFVDGLGETGATTLCKLSWERLFVSLLASDSVTDPLLFANAYTVWAPAGSPLGSWSCTTCEVPGASAPDGTVT